MSGKGVSLIKTLLLICLALAVTGVLGCSFFKKEEKRQISEPESDPKLPIQWIQVAVNYADGSLLPQSAILTLTLEDVSRMDLPPVIIGEKTLDVSGKPPFLTRVGYDPDVVKKTNTYTLRAVITHYDRLLYVSNTITNPFKKDLPSPVMVQVIRYNPAAD